MKKLDECPTALQVLPALKDISIRRLMSWKGLRNEQSPESETRGVSDTVWLPANSSARCPSKGRGEKQPLAAVCNSGR